jgi:hypothetical protein
MQERPGGAPFEGHEGARRDHVADVRRQSGNAATNSLRPATIAPGPRCVPSEATLTHSQCSAIAPAARA